jgi:hypothetical protein
VELHHLYSSNIIGMINSRMMIWVGHEACMGRSACRVVGGKPEERGPVRILKPRWEDNIKVDPEI